MADPISNSAIRACESSLEEQLPYSQNAKSSRFLKQLLILCPYGVPEAAAPVLASVTSLRHPSFSQGRQLRSCCFDVYEE
ncbi:hypothetical protein ACLOJK_010591 [Asimina triloba]